MNSCFMLVHAQIKGIVEDTRLEGVIENQGWLIRVPAPVLCAEGLGVSPETAVMQYRVANIVAGDSPCLRN